MAVFDCDLEPFAKLPEVAGSAVSGDVIRKVFEGERFLAERRLDGGAFEPGDIFESADGSYLINIRPDCDCIPRGHDKLDSLELYLLRGTDRTSELTYDEVNGLISEQDNEAIVFPVYDGRALGFKFKKLYTKKWKELKTSRRGRLLPPVLTRLQERYAAYLQRPGLTRVPVAAFPPQKAKPIAVAKNTEIAEKVEATPHSQPIEELAKPTPVADVPAQVQPGAVDDKS